MSKFYGKIGFAYTVEDPPGSAIWVGKETERQYYGDIVRNSSRWQGTDKVNDDLVFNDNFSILADPFAIDHWSSIRWVEYLGVKWKATSVEPQYPRIVISVGGVYNEH